MLDRYHHIDVRAGSGFRFWPAITFLLVMGAGIFLVLFLLVYPKRVEGVGILLLKGGLGQVTSPIGGSVELWHKEEGDTIRRGDILVTVRDLDQPDQVRSVAANQDGVIAEITAYPDVVVKKGQPLAFITKTGNPRRDLEVVGFVSSLDGGKISPGMQVRIAPTTSESRRHGYLLGEVKRVGKLPMSKAAVQSIVKIPEIAKYIRRQLEAEPFVVNISLSTDEKGLGYRWTGAGMHAKLDSGLLARIIIIYEEPSLLTLLWPSPWGRWIRDR